MKLISSLVGILFLGIVGLVICFFVFSIQQGVQGYDVLLSTKGESPKHYIGLRYKTDFMIHVYKEQTVGDQIDAALEWWKKTQTEKTQTK